MNNRFNCQNIMKEPYSRLENTALVCAARYCHNRHTSGALMLTRCLISNWERIDLHTQEQILSEAYKEATTNRDDWQILFDYANYKPTEQ